MRRSSLHSSAALLALAMAGLGAAVAQAQPYGNPNLPPSPYALPVPQYHWEDADQEDAPTPPGWHWGYWKNEGELAESIFGAQEVREPAYVPPPPPPRAIDRRHQNYCRLHPDACDQ